MGNLVPKFSNNDNSGNNGESITINNKNTPTNN